MSDLAKWNVHGPVKSVRSSHATWDSASEGWTESGVPVRFASFREDGKLSKTETSNPDGSVYICEWRYDEAGRVTGLLFGMVGGEPGETRYLYDELGRHVRTVVIEPDGSATDSETYNYDAGRKTKTKLLRNPQDNVAYSIEGTSTSVRCRGATAMRTTYDDNDLLSEVCFLDVEGNLIQRVTLVRDEAGRLLKEDIAMIASTPWPGMNFGEDQEAVVAAIGQIFADSLSSTSYIYDDRGRLIQRNHSLGTLGGDRTTYRYQDRDEAVEETTEHTTREASLNEDGTLKSGTSHIQHNRFEYTYDSHGNWTSRTVLFRLDPEPAFRLSNTERREIEYYVQ